METPIKQERVNRYGATLRAKIDALSRRVDESRSHSERVQLLAEIGILRQRMLRGEHGELLTADSILAEADKKQKKNKKGRK